MFLVTRILLVAVLLAGQPAVAQNVLDRVEPSAASRDRVPDETKDTEPAARIEVDAPSGASESRATVLAGAIALDGLKSLGPADFADIVAERVGERLGPADLATLATAIADRMRARGFVFGSAWIPVQRIQNGVLHVSIDEGRIDEIRFDGESNAAVRAALDPLVNGKAARLDDVERRLLIAGDIDGVVVRSTRYVRERERGILVVRVTTDQIAATATFSNEGTRPIGPEQIRFDVDLNRVLFSNDALILTYSGTPVEPRELQFGRARYGKRIADDGTELALTASGSIARPGAYLDRLNLESRSWFVGASVLRPLWRRRTASLWLESELGLRNLDQWRDQTRVRHDRIATARATLYGYGNIGGGRLRVSTTLSQGLGILGATRARDPMASRFDADGSFTSFNAWADWTKGLGRDFSFRVAVQSQLATRPLLIAEETGLGGTSFLRGYDWSERTGDQGAMGMVEIRYLWKNPPAIIKRAQIYAFADAGSVSNLRSGFGGGSLSSAGAGQRADIAKNLGVTLEVAVPLSGPRYDTGNRSPKLSFRLVRSF
ncbi:ShlB/FhaC/HecB family hemolysin secretion/activation protein [Sphingomonas sp. JC676]|uniref:ShlB/FhaC/HecB family hemolysin secretion/activation protein n=1 Tax=Sphingomonas sp. JC676 TaxID=2768065 RepID=UPI00165781EF|nr:ShlB/FhaC/HecB family hemolysin secretion/activation protein [Sphingomonas sp. JC676]MBC9030814.1 ShlB/FhaC/HecB family hemolysin secretion/activation protein [Sphingomonas sp. JC676]